MLSYCRRSCNHCSSSSEPGDVTGGNDGMYEWKIYDKNEKKNSTLSGTVPTSNHRNRNKIDTPTHRHDTTAYKFYLCPFSFRPLYWLPFFDSCLMITPLVSSRLSNLLELVHVSQ